MRLALGIAAIGVLFLVATAAPALAQGAFADVPSDHWAYAAVQKLAADGLIIGYPDGTFKGNRQMTRYEFAMAISRVREKLPATTGAGPVGPQGPKGDTGPAGPAGPGAGMNDRQKALMQRLETEFAPEIKQIRNDLDELTFRVEDLEKGRGTGGEAKLGISGSISYRAGFYGTDLKVNGGVTTGYFGFQGLNKDSFKASDFTTMVTKVTLAGQIRPDLMVNVTVRGEPRTNASDELSVPAQFGVLDQTNGFVDHLGLMDLVRIEEAWAKFNTKLVVPLSAKVGKQYVKLNQGLALDNGIFPLKMIDLGIGAWGKVSLHGYYGAFDREAFGNILDFPPPTFAFVPPPGAVAAQVEGQDNVTAASLMIPVTAMWTVTGGYVQSGFGDEHLWTVGVDGQLLGRKVMGEFARAQKDSRGVDVNSEENAWIVGANLIDTTNLTLGAKYGEVQAGFAGRLPGEGGSASLTALHPYAGVSPADIDWVDRPLFLDPNNIARGWEALLAYRGLAKGTMPINVRYYDGDRFGPTAGSFVSGDAVWTVSISKELAKDATATLLYGSREVENTTGISGADPIKVVRGELSVKF